MLIIYAVQKLLDSSGIEPKKYLSEPSPNQLMHAWYARHVKTGFTGKTLTMYVHQPSLLMVLTRGDSLVKTLPLFYKRLYNLLDRQHFKHAFIERELKQVEEGYVVSKTGSRSMLASMNAIIENVEAVCLEATDYDAIDLVELEDVYLDWLTYDPVLKKFRKARDFWVEQGVLDVNQ